MTLSIAAFRPRSLAALALFLGLALATLQPHPALAQQSTPQDDGPFDATEEREIKRLVREYLLENPEVLVEAIDVLRQRERQATERSRQDALAAHADALADSGPLPVFGNPEGDVTIVEFFDYRCPYCRSMVGPLLDAVRQDGNVRLIMKEYPILSEASEVAARAAIAAAMQGKYEAFHVALMTELQQVDKAGVLTLAERMDLDAGQLQADMQSETVEQELQRTSRLAEALQIGGTPAFVIGDKLIPGAVDINRLRELIAEARSGDD